MLCLRPRFGKGEIVAAVRRNEKRTFTFVIAGKSDVSAEALAKAEAIQTIRGKGLDCFRLRSSSSADTSSLSLLANDEERSSTPRLQFQAL
jgi:hypothetical protein